VNSRLTIIAQYTHIHETGSSVSRIRGLHRHPVDNYVDFGGSTGTWIAASRAVYHTIRRRTTSGRTALLRLELPRPDHSVKFGFAYRKSPVESLRTQSGAAHVARYRGIYDFVTSAYNTTLAAGISVRRDKGACTITACPTSPDAATGCDEATSSAMRNFTYTLYARNYIQDSIRRDARHATWVCDTTTSTTSRLRASSRPTDPAGAAAGDQLPGADSGARYNNFSPRIGITTT